MKSRERCPERRRKSPMVRRGILTSDTRSWSQEKYLWFREDVMAKKECTSLLFKRMCPALQDSFKSNLLRKMSRVERNCPEHKYAVLKWEMGSCHFKDGVSWENGNSSEVRIGVWCEKILFKGVCHEIFTEVLKMALNLLRYSNLKPDPRCGPRSFAVHSHKGLRYCSVPSSKSMQWCCMTAELVCIGVDRCGEHPPRRVNIYGFSSALPCEKGYVPRGDGGFYCTVCTLHAVHSFLC
jgi:hypothetical protein